MDEKRGRGREPGFIMGPEHRAKIANSKIFNNLIRAAEGEVELTQQQERISLALLKKVMPDLQSVTVEGGAEPIKHEHSVGAAVQKLGGFIDSIASRASGEPPA